MKSMGFGGERRAPDATSESREQQLGGSARDDTSEVEVPRCVLFTTEKLDSHYFPVIFRDKVFLL